MNNDELKNAINNPDKDTPLNVGDLVRIIPRDEVENVISEGYTYTNSMDEHAGRVCKVLRITGDEHVNLNTMPYYSWHRSWLEKVGESHE